MRFLQKSRRGGQHPGASRADPSPGELFRASVCELESRAPSI